jgi:hypothetical protein
VPQVSVQTKYANLGHMPSIFHLPERLPEGQLCR